ncbi:hypothetical protein LTR08_008254 [Meristemomyces frigidus]|nr:hypothetical protein LTR08_008254 [Meristemomyces frigidus]
MAGAVPEDTLYVPVRASLVDDGEKVTDAEVDALVAVTGDTGELGDSTDELVNTGPVPYDAVTDGGLGYGTTVYGGYGSGIGAVLEAVEPVPMLEVELEPLTGDAGEELLAEAELVVVTPVPHGIE